MFPRFSIKELMKHYEDNGKTKSGTELSYPGVWSILLTKNPGESVDFARRYFDEFNKISGPQWNLCICSDFEIRNEKINWIESQYLYEYENAIRNRIEDQTNKKYDMCIAFYNPTANDSDFGRHTLIVPLSKEKIGNAPLYEKGFRETHECILSAAKRKNISLNHKISDGDYDNLLSCISSEMEKKKIYTFGISTVKCIGNALLGAWIGNTLTGSK